jgi:prepilin-type N-terminal cleavage/methylation domain-containing protein
MVRESGYTLVELLMVVAIIAVLSAIAIPKLLTSRLVANEVAAIADIRDQQKENTSRSPGTTWVCPSPPTEFSGMKSGYVRGCTAGVYWAIPEAKGRTGNRGFGGDSSGRICFTTDGSVPVMTGACNVLK